MCDTVKGLGEGAPEMWQFYPLISKIRGTGFISGSVYEAEKQVSK